MACIDCPQQITETIAREVRDMMARVQRVKRLTTMFQRLLEDIASTYLNTIVRRLDELYALLPEPPICDLAFYQSLISCPLTPLAFALDPALMAQYDPRAILKRFKDSARAFLAKMEDWYDMTLSDIESLDPRPLATIIEQDYESLFPSDAAINSGLTASSWAVLNAQAQSPGAGRSLSGQGVTGAQTTRLTSPKDRMGDRSVSNNVPVRIARKYIREVVRALEDPVDFAVQFAEVTAIVEYVRITCSEIYYSPSWPFVYWYDTVTGFEINTATGLPSIIQGAMYDLSAKFMQIELKLFRWQAFIAAPL